MFRGREQVREWEQCVLGANDQKRKAESGEALFDLTTTVCVSTKTGRTDGTSNSFCQNHLSWEQPCEPDCQSLWGCAD